MNKKLYTVRDVKTGIYEVPLAQISHGEAERTFQSLLKDSNSKISKYPEDFELYYLGDYDNLTGTVIPNSSPQFIMNGAAVKLEKGTALNS